ncbi:MAG: hypothetical protein CM15mP49_35130 [Actinomycetota bacterium]|nr:MAG: hypothetical protein CM15mP49_35130 [Actinomycetota bacterium]
MHKPWGVVTKSRSTMPQENGCASAIASLLQGGSFTEVGQLAGGEVDAFIAGIGSLNGRPVAVGCEDFTVKGGSIGRAESAKRYRIAELALQERIPLIMLLEGAGHRPPLPDDPPSFRTPGDLQAQAMHPDDPARNSSSWTLSRPWSSKRTTRRLHCHDRTSINIYRWPAPC